MSKFAKVIHLFPQDALLDPNLTLPLLESVPPESAPQTQTPTESPSPSKWDQIRAVNAATTTSSSWDALRQRHEKPRAQDSDMATAQNPNEQVDDRTAEQARFDALLEKERNFGSQSTRE